MSHPYHQHHHLQSERHNTIPSPLIASTISKVEQCSCCVKAWSITLLVITILGVLASASSLDRNTRLCEYDIDDCDDYEVIVVISAILSWISYAISISFAIKGIIASSRKTSHQANILKKWFKIWVITNVICIITSYGLYIYAVNVIL